MCLPQTVAFHHQLWTVYTNQLIVISLSPCLCIFCCQIMYIMFMFMHMLCISYYVIWLVIDVMTYDDVIEEQSLVACTVRKIFAWKRIYLKLFLKKESSYLCRMSTDSDKPFHCQFPGCGQVRSAIFSSLIGPSMFVSLLEFGREVSSRRPANWRRSIPINGCRGQWLASYLYLVPSPIQPGYIIENV